MRKKIWIVVLAATAAAQTKIDLRTQGKSVDFSAATSTKPSKTGTAFPATCSIGETFFKSDAPAGANLYGCTATNIWSAQGGGSSSLPAITGNANRVLSNNGTIADWRAFNGDVTGAPDSITVNGLRGRSVSSSAPANSQVLTWSTINNRWEPQNPSAGSGTNAVQLQGRNLAATAPADTQVICWDATGTTWKPCTSSSGATSISQLTDLKATRTSGTLLNIASGLVSLNGISYFIPAGTVGISAGTGTVRIGVDTSVTPPTGKVYFSAGMTVTCSGMGSCTTPVASSAFTADDLQLATWTATSGTFDANGGTELRSALARGRTVTGTGMTSSISGHTQTISVDTSLLPIFTLIPGTGANLASATTVAPTNRTHHITGTTAVATITATGMMDGEKLTLIPNGAFSLVTSGNIGSAQSAIVSQAIDLTWDATAAKWYPVVASATGGGGGTSTSALTIFFPGPMVAGAKICTTIALAGTITGEWIINTNTTGSIQFDVFKSAYSTTAADPTVANTIVASAPPILSSARRASGNPTGWTTSIAAKDTLCGFITSASTTATEASLILQVTR